ncbi:MAG: porin family protein [Prevotella sp.]|nr:porin family protein [Prevotella sp.]
MKKLLMIIAVMIGFAANASAQDTKMAIGVQGVTISGIFNPNYGIGGRFQYNFTDNFRGEVSGDYYFKEDLFSAFDMNAMAHYVFHLGQKFAIYPAAGVGIMGLSGGGSTETTFNFVIGAGLEYNFTENVKAYLEPNGIFGDGSGLKVSLGLAYCF